MSIDHKAMYQHVREEVDGFQAEKKKLEDAQKPEDACAEIAEFIKKQEDALLVLRVFCVLTSPYLCL